LKIKNSRKRGRSTERLGPLKKRKILTNYGTEMPKVELIRQNSFSDADPINMKDSTNEIKV